MEVEDIHAPKRSRMGNVGGGGGANADSGRLAAARLGQEQRQDDDDDENGEGRSLFARGGGGAVAGVRGLRPWQQHNTVSRIYRVSRASGGKDRHSKVMTSKGLRDRRVRLSVTTAIQFYDLQDRLGYDQPSKAIEWLIKAAAAAIADLPALVDGAFSNQPPSGRQPGDEEKPAGEADEDEEDADVSQLQYTNHHHLQHQQEEHQTQQRQQQQRISLTKSTCSSTSETSKGSGLSLSRSEIRIKARERARERTATAKDKEKDKEDIEDDAHVPSAAHHQSMNPNPTSQSSFTELLTGGGHQNHTQHNHVPVTVAQAIPAPNFIQKQLRHLPTPATARTTTDYFGQVDLLGAGQKPQQPNIFPTQTHFGSSSAMGMVPFNVAAATTAGDHPEMQQHYVQEHLIPFAVTAAGGDYINFSLSSGFNRGTLQSNSPSPLLHHHLQMFSSPVDGSNLPFFLGAVAQASSASGEDQLPAGFDSRLQLCYRHPDLKGKGKN